MQKKLKYLFGDFSILPSSNKYFFISDENFSSD
jgi:hypothetical protein